jgi:hypothetical protein
MGKPKRKVNLLPLLGIEPVVFGTPKHRSNHLAKPNPPKLEFTKNMVLINATSNCKNL